MLFKDMRTIFALTAFFLISSFSVQASLVTGNSNFRRNVSNTGRITLNSQAEWFRLTEPGLCQVLGYIRASHESGNRHPGTKNRARFYDPAIGRFISRDPVFGNIASPMSQHPYVYGNLNPYRFVDPMGEAAETPWDAASLAVGLYSIKSWNKNTSWLDKGLDLLGVTVDGLATATPFVPGGAGMALKAWRASRTFRVLNKTDQVLSAVSGAYSSGSSMAEEGLGFGNSAQMVLSTAGILPKTAKNMGVVAESATNIQEVVGKKLYTRPTITTLMESFRKPGTRKFTGEDATGPIRVRIEKPHISMPDYKGPKDPLHDLDHLHIERKIHGQTGKWESLEKYEFPYPFED